MGGKSKFLTPSHLVKSALCAHALFLEYYGDESEKRGESSAEKMVRDQGMHFQTKLTRELTGIDLSEAKTVSLEEAFLETETVLKLGHDYVAQPALIRGDEAGIPDLLKKTRQKSGLGNFSYEPVEIKSHRSIQFSDCLQLFFYAYLLEPLLGYRPERGWLVIADGSFREVSLSGKLERQFFAHLEQARTIRKGNIQTKAYRCSFCSRCLWSRYCWTQWQDSDHLSMISGLSAAMARKLESHGIETCGRLAECDASELAEILKSPLKMTRRFVLGARARTEQRPIILSKPDFPSGRTAYFYDIETCDDVVFCHGIIRVSGSEREARTFFSDRPGDEKNQWHLFLDYMSRDDNPVVYCWTFYERQFVESLWAKYGGNEKGYRNLKKGLVDQCAFVRSHFVLPCRGYSIKMVAPWFGFRWASEDANGMNCVAWYQEWLVTKCADLKQKIIRYNTDDVEAMVVVDENLKALCGAD